MKTKKKDEERNVIRDIIELEWDSESIEQVCTGEITHISMRITENNQYILLENIDGNLVLDDESLPANHGCYLYNEGDFPYFVKDTIEFMILNDGKDKYLFRIIYVYTEPGTRFNYQGAGKPIVEDPNGDSCVWEVNFEVVPILREQRAYLMRWNPKTSSFKEKDFEECVADRIHDMFRLDWSIHEWEEARRGDMFYMMRVDDDKPGIVFFGQFVTDPYPDECWNGSTKRRMYVDIVCTIPDGLISKPLVSLKKLQKAIPEVKWTKGHSGVRLSEEVWEKLSTLVKKAID